MGQYLNFCWECIKWAYGRWQRGEPMISSLCSLAITIGGIIGAFVAQRWWIVLIPLGILVIFVAPYKVWKTSNDRLTKLTTKRLEISLPEPGIRKGRDNVRGEWFQEWHKMKVYNPTALPISECYGKLIKCDSKLPYPNLPSSGIMFPWSSYSGTGKLIKIGSHDFDFLDILVFDGRYISVVTLDDASGQRNLSQFPLLIDKDIDEYRLTIQIGSQQDDALPPSRVILKITPCVENLKKHIQVTMLDIDSQDY